MSKVDFFVLAKKAAEIADDKKADETTILDVRDLTSIANYFVITTARSTPQINAITDEIEKTFKEQECISPLRREGVSSASWRVVDYGGIVIHVMSPEIRESYKLENLWNNTKIINPKKKNIKVKKKLTNKVGGKSWKTR
ncbi:MAG: ribosome silencing factor [Endomicrobium sp.]|jgi:ribosome-associated protein|nr:ribosome silencing factor [Endomicrobium sp.]